MLPPNIASLFYLARIGGRRRVVFTLYETSLVFVNPNLHCFVIEMQRVTFFATFFVICGFCAIFLHVVLKQIVQDSCHKRWTSQQTRDRRVPLQIGKFMATARIREIGAGD